MSAGRPTRPAWSSGEAGEPANPRLEFSASADSIAATAVADLWSVSGSGARSGRGYHYQDTVGAWLAALAFCGQLSVHRLVSEGFEDFSLEGDDQWYIQVKSRQQRVGDFSGGEAAAHVVNSWKAHRERELLGLSGRLAVVFERPVDGENLSGWGLSIAESVPPGHAFLHALHSNAKTQGLSVAEAEQMCVAVCVVVLGWEQATDETVDAIVSRTGLLPGTAIPAVLALRGAIANCADENAERGWDNRAGLSRTDIETHVQRSVELVDREALAGAVSAGICESVDFRVKDAPAGFYEGLDVQPAHLVAGLVQPRPTLTGEVVEALMRSQSALVVGPSGVGKSAVLWSTVHVTRHVLWYRIWHLYEADVEPLIRLARATGASPRTPVGFVVDAVGRADVQAWDALQRQVQAIPGLYLLGTARNEDLFALRSLSECGQVHVSLDKDLAERIYRGLREAGATSAPHWRHAYEQADGLTLEFAHLLTRGRRLAMVVADQIRTRLDQHRDTELAVLAAVSVAHRWGASLSIGSLRKSLNISDAGLARILSRLKDELLLRIEHGRVCGLHQLRSEAIVEAIHATGSPDVFDSVRTVVSVAEESQLRPFVAGLLVDHPDADGVVLDALAARFEESADPVLLTEILQGLRVVDFHRISASWPAVLDRHAVTPACRVSTLQLVLWTGRSPDGVRPEMEAARAEIAASYRDEYALRDALLLKVGAEHVVTALLSSSCSHQATGLLGTLANCPAEIVDDFTARSLADTALTHMLREQEVGDLAAVMSAARSASIQLASGLFEALGGQAAMVKRFCSAYPWAIDVHIAAGTQTTAVVRLMHIGNDPDYDSDENARQLGRLLLRCFPQCDACDVTTHLATGVNYRIGDIPVGWSALQRRYEHGLTDVSWSRMRLRIAASPIGMTDTATWLHTASLLIDDLSEYLDDYLRLWLCCTDDTLDVKVMVAQTEKLVERSEQLSAPVEQLRPGAEDVHEQGKTPSTHPLNMLVSGLAVNLAYRLTQQDQWLSLTGFVNVTLPQFIEQLRRQSWHLIGASKSPAALDRICTTLSTLHDVLKALTSAEATLEQLRGIAQVGDSARALRRAAAAARALIIAAEQRRAHELEQQFAAAGLHVRLHSRWSGGKALAGVVEQAATVELGTTMDWPSALETLAPILADRHFQAPFLIVPFRNGRPLRELSQQFILTFLPARDVYDTWANALPEPHQTPLASALAEARQAICALSALAEVSKRRQVLDPHAERGRQLTEKLTLNLGFIAETVSRQPPQRPVQYLGRLLHRLEAELNGHVQGDTIAADYAKGIVGEETSDLAAFPHALLDAYEWDTDVPLERP